MSTQDEQLSGETAVWLPQEELYNTMQEGNMPCLGAQPF